MNLIALLVGGIWAGVFAAALAIVFSVPVNAVFSGFCGGFVARFSRDVLLGWGAKPELATLVAAALVVFVGALLAAIFSSLVLKRLLGAHFHFDPKATGLAIVLTAALANLSGWLASFRILRQKPLEVLRDE